MTTKPSPPAIDRLAPNGVFVFGANSMGVHGAGASRTARLAFGAVRGRVGHVGQSYGLVVNESPSMRLPLETVQENVAQFVRFAADHPELDFFVSLIGCGHPGFDVETMAPLFAGCLELPNVYLPQPFLSYLLPEDNCV